MTCVSSFAIILGCPMISTQNGTPPTSTAIVTRRPRTNLTNSCSVSPKVLDFD